MRHPPIAYFLAAFLITTSAGATAADRINSLDVTRYCVTEIGLAESGLEYLHIADMNQRGQALGWGYLGEGVEVFQWDLRRGYSFIGELAHVQEVPVRAATAVNDFGQIVGTQSIDPDGALRAVVWSRGKGLRRLEPAPGDDHSEAVDINNRGQVLGTSGPYPSDVTLGVRAVIWDHRSDVQVIPDFPDTISSFPYAINEAGQVIGGSETQSGGMGYIWDRTSGIRVIPSLQENDSSSSPRAINDHGEVVGSGSLSQPLIFDGRVFGTQAIPKAIFWSESRGIVDLGDLPGGIESSSASDINNHGQIVGYGTSSDGAQAVIWDAQGQIHNLNQLLVRDDPDNQFLYLYSARMITDAGWITAIGGDTPDNRFRTFVLKPARLSPTGSYRCSYGK